MPDIGPFIRTDYKEVDKRDEVRNVLGWVRGDSSKLPVVTDHGKPFGIVNERTLVNRSIDDHAKLEGTVLVTRALPLQASLEEAIARMAEFRAAYMPVEDDKGKLAGYVSAMDIVRDRVDGQRAGDLALPVKLLTKTQSMSEAHHLFHQEYVDFLPVMDGNGRVEGVLPRRTLLRLESNLGTGGRKDVVGERRHPLQEPVSGYLDENLCVVSPETPGTEVLAKVEKYGYAIVQGRGGDVIGLVTPETLVRVLGKR